MFKFVTSNGGQFKALIAAVYNDLQYMVYVEDTVKLNSFLKTENVNFIDNQGQINVMTNVGRELQKIYLILEHQGYSKIDARSHAIAAVMDLYNTGLKIYRRENSNARFRALGVEFSFDPDYIDSFRYTPIICH